MILGMFDNEQPGQCRNDEIRMSNVEGNHNHEAPIGSATHSNSNLFKVKISVPPPKFGTA